MFYLKESAINCFHSCLTFHWLLASLCVKGIFEPEPKIQGLNGTYSRQPSNLPTKLHQGETRSTRKYKCFWNGDPYHVTADLDKRLTTGPQTKREEDWASCFLMGIYLYLQSERKAGSNGTDILYSYSIMQCLMSGVLQTPFQCRSLLYYNLQQNSEKG